MRNAGAARNTDPALTFRFARMEDVENVWAIIERAYRAVDGARGWTTEADILDGPRTSTATIGELVASDGRFLVAEAADGAIVGCVFLRQTGEDAYFGMFAVDPNRQGGGIGAAVITAAEAAARDLWSSRRMTMNVISIRTDLIAWYVRRGYAPTGSREPFPFHETIPIRTDFDLVQLAKRL